jgi:hypothetical protein
MYLFSLEITQGKLHNKGKENKCQSWHNNINNIIDNTHMYHYKILFSRRFLNGGRPHSPQPRLTHNNIGMQMQFIDPKLSYYAIKNQQNSYFVFPLDSPIN